MKQNLKLMFPTGEITRQRFNISSLYEGKDFKIITENIIDKNGEFYYSFEDYIEQLNLQGLVRYKIEKDKYNNCFYIFDKQEQIILHNGITSRSEALDMVDKLVDKYLDQKLEEGFYREPDFIETEYAWTINGEVNILNAKKCHFGVIELLREASNVPKQMMYALSDDKEDLALQFIAYDLLTYGYTGKKEAASINEPIHLECLRALLGDDIYRELLERLNMEDVY